MLLLERRDFLEEWLLLEKRRMRGGGEAHSSIDMENGKQ